MALRNSVVRARESLLGPSTGSTRIYEWKRGFRIDLGYSPVAEREGGSADVTFTYVARF